MKRAIWMLMFFFCSEPVMAEMVQINNYSCNFVVRQYITPPAYAQSMWDALEPFTLRNLKEIVRIDRVSLNPLQIEDVTRQALSICMDGQETHWFEALRHAVLGDQWVPLKGLPDPIPKGFPATYNEQRDRSAYLKSLSR